MRRATEKTQYQAGWTLHFYPRSPCGERLKHLENRAQDLAFLSTLSLRRATFQLDVMITTFYYFYPRSPCGERPNTTRCRVIRSYFYPRSPCGERHSRRRYKYLSHQSSIHALLAESDAISGYSPAAGRNFYPRSPCGERPRRCSRRRFCPPHFYPRSPCGERPGWRKDWQQYYSISIHALLAESDIRPAESGQGPGYFYPRSPCGERRQAGQLQQRTTRISIHALLAESDRCDSHSARAIVISIHALLAESDTDYRRGVLQCPIFLSTLSLRRATISNTYIGSSVTKISIHALLAESDFVAFSIAQKVEYFYPRSPCGERLP